ASRPRLPPHRGELGKFCASSSASSANLLAFVYGPPWAWIDGNPVLAELHIEYRLVCTARFGNGRLSSISAMGAPVTRAGPSERISAPSQRARHDIRRRH